MSTVYEKYIKVSAEHPDRTNRILVQVYYTLGGYSYWAGKTIPRGYYVSVVPIGYVENAGIVVTSSTLGAGCKHLLVKCKRKSRKCAEEAIKIAQDGIIGAMVAKICEEHRLTLVIEDDKEE